MCDKTPPSSVNAGSANSAGFYAGENPITKDGQEILKNLYNREAYLHDQLHRVREAREQILSDEGRKELRVYETIIKAQNKVQD